MTKKQYFKIILSTVLITLVFDIFISRYLVAKISTFPILNKFKILSPQAPIVINNRETVRVSDSGDAVSATNALKSKISSIVFLNNSGGLTYAGTALNLTSDGVFLTASSSFKQNENSYYVILNDGRTAKITTQVLDPAVSLMFFKADIENISVVNFGDSKELNVGEKILFVNNSLHNFLSRSILSLVNSSEKDIQGKIFHSDFPSLSFGVNVNSELKSGEAVINTSGDVVGIWNGTKLITTSNIRPSIVLYYAATQKISRPSFGFTYRIVTDNESKLTGVSKGAFVEVVSGANIKSAGLLEDDVITKIDSTEINEVNTLEEYLQKYKPGDTINFTVKRKNIDLKLKFLVSELK